MRPSLLCLLLVLFLVSPAWCQVNTQKPVSHSFQKTDLVLVLKTLAQEMGISIQLDPTVHGTVTIDLVDVPAEEALLKVLALQKEKYSFKLLPNILVVAPAGGLVSIDRGRVAKPPAPPLRAMSKGMAVRGVGYHSSGSARGGSLRYP